MSYILEALKKSEKRRQEETAATRLHQHLPKPPAAAKEDGRLRPLLLFCFLACICAVAAGASLFFLGDEDSPSSLLADSAPPVDATAPRPVTESMEHPAVPVLDAGAVKTTPAQEKAVIQPAPLTAEEIESLPAIARAGAVAASIPALEELDDAFIQSVPQFTMAGHVYSDDPELRMILINNRVVREKDVVEKDYIVDEITPDGIVMRLGEIRFRLSAD